MSRKEWTVTPRTITSESVTDLAGHSVCGVQPGSELRPRVTYRGDGRKGRASRLPPSGYHICPDLSPTEFGTGAETGRHWKS